jgi:histidinol-phosphate aminotransferase
MSRYWNDRVRGLVPYVPGEQPKDERDWIKLNTNENPYPPSPSALAAIRDALGDSLRLYPDPDGTPLREALAEYYDLSPEEVFVGNGSDEILAFAFMTFFDSARPVVFPDITYSFYPVYAAHFGIPFRTVELEEDFALSADKLIRAAEGGGGILFPNPNAPTGVGLPLTEVRKILDRADDQLVLIDEAYVDFGGETAAGLIRSYPNLLVVQTLSKSRSFAGLRVGFALGNADLIRGLERVKHSFNSYTLDRLALAGAVAAIRDEAHFAAARDKIIAARERTIAALRELGFIIPPSQANFFMAGHPQLNAREVQQALRDRGILVRHFAKPRIDGYLRITVGTDEQMDRLIACLRELLLHENRTGGRS